MVEPPAWLKEGALVWSRVDRWKPWKKYRVRRIKASRTCRSGYMVTLQKLEPPFYGGGREVDASFCREAFEDEPAPDVSWDGTRPEGVDVNEALATDAGSPARRREDVPRDPPRGVPEDGRGSGDTPSRDGSD